MHTILWILSLVGVAVTAFVPGIMQRSGADPAGTSIIVTKVLGCLLCVVTISLLWYTGAMD